MLNHPKTAETSGKPSIGHLGGVRSKLAIALVAGMSMAGCSSEKPEEIALPGSATAPVASAKTEVKSPEPEKNICDEKIRTDENIKKYPRAPRANIQRILDHFPGSHSTIENLSGNGCRDVVVFEPNGFDPGKNIELQYHFHGSLGNFIGMPVPYDTKLLKKGRESAAVRRLTAALTIISSKVQRDRRNTLLVYPLSAGRREGGDPFAYNFAYDDFWMKSGNDTGDDMKTLDSQVRQLIKARLGVSTQNATVTLSGHSAGGRPIMHAIQSGFMPDRIRFLEASYNDWAKEIYQKIGSEKRDIPFEIFFKPQADTQAAALAMRGKKDVTVIPVEGKLHGQFLDLL